MSFAFVPDDGPPRLIRFVGPDQFPSSDTIATLDRPNNLLRVNRELFEQLDKEEQEKVLRTSSPFLEVATTN